MAKRSLKESKKYGGMRNKERKEPFSPALNVAKAVSDIALDNGLIVFPGNGTADGIIGDHILIGPPLIVDRAQIGEIVRLLRKSIETAGRKLSL